MPSAYGDWRPGGSGGPLDLQRLHDEREFVDAFGRELIQLLVLEREDSVHEGPDLMDRQVPVSLEKGIDATTPEHRLRGHPANSLSKRVGAAKT